MTQTNSNNSEENYSIKTIRMLLRDMKIRMKDIDYDLKTLERRKKQLLDEKFSTYESIIRAEHLLDKFEKEMSTEKESDNE